MMNTFTASVSLLLFAAMAGATETSTSIRGASTSDGQRQLLFHESTCTLYRKCVTFGPSEEHPHGHHKDSWVCQLSENDSGNFHGVQFVDIIESESVSQIIANATSGKTTLTISDAKIDALEPRMFITDDANIRVRDISIGTERVARKHDTDRDLTSDEDVEEEQEIDDHHSRRRLSDGPPTIGELRTLVVRLTDKNNVAVTSDVNKLVNDVFTDSVSLKTQTEACSYGKLKIEPFRGNTPSNEYINNGVVDVTMDWDMTTPSGGWDQAAMKATKEVVGDLNNPMFDLIMFCAPPGKSDFLAFAYPNSKYSFYNNEWCGFVAGQMHEVGHNLGLAHSGQVGEGEYGDGTGYMGGSAALDDLKMCYNPQKSYQLGWYEDQTKTINPLDGISHREFTLNGVADYGDNKDALVVLRLRQAAEDKDYYIGYNRASGINDQTGEDRDTVTVVRKEWGVPEVYAQSTKIASLRPGQRVVIPNFNGSNKDVQIAFVGLTDDKRDARIMILDNDQVPPSPPGSCTKFVVEVQTDGYPGDNTWYIKDKTGWGRVAAISMPFTNQNTKYAQEVCLPQGVSAKSYIFAIEDKYGDGMGGGGYKVYNHQNQLQFQGGSNFSSDQKWVTHNIDVQADPNPPPPTNPPTLPPTQAPTGTPPCVDHRVEVKTDGYPGDSSWKFIVRDELDDEHVVVTSPQYTSPGPVVTTVCLHEGWEYVFRFMDSYGDGLCCGENDSSKGYYKVLAPSGDVLVDSGLIDVDFKVKDYNIIAGAPITTEEEPPTAQPTKAPTQKCKNKVKKRFKVNPDAKKKNCRWYAKKKKCNLTVEGGKYSGKKISELCAKNCKVC